MRGMAILMLYNLIGIAGNKLLHVPLPGNVIGMMLPAASLLAGWVKLAWLEQSAQYLLEAYDAFFRSDDCGRHRLFRRHWGVVAPDRRQSVRHRSSCITPSRQSELPQVYRIIQ